MAGEDEEDSIKPFYLREFRKGGKGLGALLHDLSTDELLELIKRINEDTPENIIRREEMALEVKVGQDKVTDQEKKYFMEKRGEHGKYKGKPKSYTLKKGQEKEQATELIREHAFAAIEREFGKDAVKHYKDNPEKIITYLAGKGVDFYNVQRHLADNPRNIDKLSEGSYFEMKSVLSEVDNEETTLEFLLENEINKQTDHHEKTKKWAKKHALSDNMNIKDSATIGQYMNVAKRVIGNLINEKYKKDTGYIDIVK